MRKAWKIRTAMVLGLALIGCMLLSNTQTAEARPQYNKQFVVVYPKLAALQKKSKCGTCHPMKSKKVLNSYSKAVKAALPGKNCKDKDAITKAFKAAEGKMSDVAGKTFGQLIEDGKLPNAK